MAYYEGTLIAHAIFIRKHFSKEGWLSWVLQLVVHSKYRQKDIAKTLLHSIWGYSNDIAWGLATPNPFTVKALEAATFRKVDPKHIYRHMDKLKKIGNLVPFVVEYKVDESNSLVDTKFYIDHSDIPNKINKAYGKKWPLGALPEGHEWLAFTFRSQDMIMNKRDFKIFHSILHPDKVLIFTL